MLIATGALEPFVRNGLFCFSCNLRLFFVLQVFEKQAERACFKPLIPAVRGPGETALQLNVD